MRMMYKTELYHHGIKGQKWGIRRFQNKDGSLTPAGKKRASKEYKQAAMEAEARFMKNQTRIQVDAYNKAADYMNEGGIARYNEAQRKKYGENYMDRDGYIEDYELEFDKVFAKCWNKAINEFYTNDASIKKARDLVKKYDMTKWDDLAKKNEAAIEDVRRVVESYND